MLSEAGHRPAGRLRARPQRGAGPPLRVQPPRAPAAGQRRADRRHLGRARAAHRHRRRRRPLGRHQRPQRPPAAGHPGERLRPRRPHAPARRHSLSFGFKYGLPLDADLVVDARFLPNPHWVPELRRSTGRDPEVRDYVLGQEDAGAFLDRYTDVLRLLSPAPAREGKRYLTLAVGCTGGKHRSVAMAEVRPRLLPRGWRPRPATATWAASSAAPPVPGARGWWRFGGGHGLAAALAAWRPITPELTAVVTVADDGGSSGRIRREMPVLPPGELRMALAALAGDSAAADVAAPPPAPAGRHRCAGRPPGRQPGAHRAHRDARRRHGAGARRHRGAARRPRPGAPMADVPLDLVATVESIDPDDPHAPADPRPGGDRRHPGPVREILLRRPTRRSPAVLEAIAAADIVCLGPGLLVHLRAAAPARPAAAGKRWRQT